MNIWLRLQKFDFTETGSKQQFSLGLALEECLLPATEVILQETLPLAVF